MKKTTLVLILLAFTTLGYAQYLSEGFETSIPPSGWTLNSTNSGDYTWSLSTGNPYSGTYSAQVQYDPDLSPQDESLVSPIIDLTSATSPQLTFWFNMSYYWSVDPYSNYDFIVSITDGTTTTPLWDHTDFGVFDNFAWYEISLDLSAYTGTNNMQLVFSYVGVDGASLDIDDILVFEPPTCPDPSLLSANNFTINSADLLWLENGSSNNWDIEWGTTGFSPTGTPTINDTNNNPYPLSGLDIETFYDFYVRSDCGMDNSSDVSAWVGPFTFSTLCDSTGSPYVIDFEGSLSTPNCTSVINDGSGNVWTVVSNPGYGFTTNTLRYAWNTTNAANTWFFTQGLNLTGGQSYTITYDYGNSSATTYDEKMRVAYGTSPSSISMTNTLADYPNVLGADLINDSIEFTPATSDIYYFGFQAYSDADEFYLFVDNISVDVTLSIDDAAQNQFTYYPNPVKSTLNLNAQSNIQNVSICNMLGQEILKTTPNNVDSTVDMSSLQTGAYFVKVTINDRTETIRVIKQ